MPKTFSELGIHKSILQSLTDLSLTQPTEIQEKAMPEILTTTADVVGLAKTGTGKTLAFGVPMIQLVDTEKSDIQTLILAPTRELGQQIAKNLKQFSTNLPEVIINSFCGGIPIKPQIEELKNTNHIVIATPGRLIDLMERGAINLTNVNHLVLDEADEMLTALKDGLDTIITKLPKKRRTLLFTATMSGAVKQLVNNYMQKNVTQITVAMETKGHLGIDHQFVVVEPIEKLEVLMHFLASREGQRGIIFCKTKAAVNKLAKKLAINKFSSGAIHGSLSQGIRDRIMEQFRNGYIDILIATDLVSRGIDVKEVEYVVNYHLPDVYEAYIHRTGRTARAGAKGFALTVLQEEERIDIGEFEEELGISFIEYKKADKQSIEDNNTILWAKKIFKMKPNRDIDSNLKKKIHTVFHHLTKDELIDKLLAQHVLGQKSIDTDTKPKPKKKQK